LPLQQLAPAVALVLEAPTRAQLPSTRRFPPTVELHLLTRDGTAGTQGTLESEGDDAPLRRLLRWADHACFACTPERYPALARIVEEARFQPADDFAQALARVPMPCGVGACDVCRLRTRRGERRACVDGPVFNLLELDS
jgi:NAD(P)H-flavin reductase